MTEQQKDLLVKDLCARLRYGVKVKIYDKEILNYGEGEIGIIDGKEVSEDDYFTIKAKTDRWIISIDEFKPYLRPMSNMTEEERNEWTSLMRKEHREAYPNSAIDTSYYEYFPTPESFDYLIENMFDYRGLIPKGLALEAQEGMYK